MEPGSRKGQSGDHSEEPAKEKEMVSRFGRIQNKDVIDCYIASVIKCIMPKGKQESLTALLFLFVNRFRLLGRSTVFLMAGW